jgi:hypothetical protein
MKVAHLVRKHVRVALIFLWALRSLQQDHHNKCHDDWWRTMAASLFSWNETQRCMFSECSWFVALCSIVGRHRHFKGTWCFYLQGVHGIVKCVMCSLKAQKRVLSKDKTTTCLYHCPPRKGWISLHTPYLHGPKKYRFSQHFMETLKEKVAYSS